MGFDTCKKIGGGTKISSMI